MKKAFHIWVKAKQRSLALLKKIASWARALPWFWIGCKELWCESVPLWFPLLSVILAILAGLKLDQTQGILQAMIDPPVAKALATAQRYHFLFFLIGLCVWSFVNFLATRWLHEFDYNSPEYAGRLSQHKGWIGRLFQALERFSPMLMGLGPPVAVGIAFYVLGQSYSAENALPIQSELLLFTPCLIVIFLLVVLRPRRPSPRLQEGGRRKLNEVLSKKEMILIPIFLACIGALIAVTFYAPQIWPLFGPGATLCLAASVFVFIGSLLVFLGGRWRVPLIFITLLICTFISPLNDNHEVRITRGPEFAVSQKAIGIVQALEGWKGRLCLDEPDRKPGQKTPLIIICAEGGGVRAAYWAARLLAYLEDTTRKYPDQYVPFSSRVVAISGVSGGSLGAATFSALLDQNPVTDGQKTKTDWFYEHVANFLGRDHLSTPLASAAFIDTPQRFLPFKLFDQNDRAVGLELAWEYAWRQSLLSVDNNPTGFCGFDEDFRTLWRKRGDVSAESLNGRKRWLPSLFFNGTSVELGGRIVVSDCLVPSENYPGAQDALRLLKLRKESGEESESGLFRLSTAVNFSTRFPGISSAGKIPPLPGQLPQHVVDGGYYDNSGARTAWDNLVAIYYKLLDQMDATQESSQIIPWVISVRAGPPFNRATPDFPTPTPGSWNATPQQLMVDVLAPPRAFLNAWISRSADAAEALKDGTCLISRRLAGSKDKGKDLGEKNVTVPPLERVDYSIQRPAFRRPGDGPRFHDPFVIDLNLELDERNVESATSDARRKRLLPLGWMLPAKAMQIMDIELETRLAPKADLLKKKTHDEKWFRELQETQLGRVLSLLHRERPGNASQEPVPPCPSPSPTSTATATPGPTPTPSSTPTATPTPKPTPSATPTATPRPFPSSTPTATQTPRPTPSPPPPSPNPSPTPSPSPIVSPTPKGPVCAPRRRVDLRPPRQPSS